MCVVDFELICGDFDPDDIVTLEYDIESNNFIDISFGHPILDIHRLLKPWQIYLFKHYKRDYVFPDVTSTFLVQLIYSAS